MRTFFIPILLLLFFSCDKKVQEETFPLNVSPIVGDWQVVAETYSVGGPPITVQIENGGVYTFLLDGTFRFSESLEISKAFTGDYTFEEGILTLSYTLDDEEIIRKLDTLFQENLVELWPAGPILCIEGCSFTLLRIE